MIRGILVFGLLLGTAWAQEVVVTVERYAPTVSDQPTPDMRQEAVRKALRQVLQSRLSVKELEAFASAAQQLLRNPGPYVRAITEESLTVRGRRIVYRAKIVLHQENLNRFFRLLGLKGPNDQFVLLQVPVDLKSSLGYDKSVVKSFLQVLAGYGVGITTQSASGQLQWHAGRERVPHPLDPEEEVVRYPLAVTVEYGGRRWEGTFYPSSDPFVLPLEVQVVPLVDWLYRQLWVEDPGLYRLGPLMFSAYSEALRLYQKMQARPQLFLSVHPVEVRYREGEWQVEFAFRVLPGEETNVEAWLNNELGYPLKREGRWWHP